MRYLTFFFGTKSLKSRVYFMPAAYLGPWASFHVLSGLRCLVATGVGSANLNSRAAVLCSYMNGM